jgi:transposase InsO family protein
MKLVIFMTLAAKRIEAALQRIADCTVNLFRSRRRLGREGCSIARCTVARLMRANGIEGAVREKPLRTNFSDKAAPCPKDHVNREFQASAPKRLWVSDFTRHV